MSQYTLISSPIRVQTRNMVDSKLCKTVLQSMRGVQAGTVLQKFGNTLHRSDESKACQILLASKGTLALISMICIDTVT